MGDIALSALQALVVFALTYFGFEVTLDRPQWHHERQRFRTWFWAFGAISVVLILVQTWHSNKDKRENAARTTQAETQRQLAEAQHAASLTRLETASQETVRLQTENAELQKRLLDSNKTIARLAQASIDATTGGGSFCYMRYDKMTDTTAVPNFIHVGAYAIDEVVARIYAINDQDEELLADGTPLTKATKQQFDQATKRDTIHLGLIIPSSKFFPQDAALLGTATRFKVVFAARNGSWTQQHRRSKVGEKWYQAFRVRKDIPKPSKVIFTHIDKDFPRDQLRW